MTITAPPVTRPITSALLPPAGSWGWACASCEALMRTAACAGAAARAGVRSIGAGVGEAEVAGVELHHALALGGRALGKLARLARRRRTRGRASPGRGVLRRGRRLGREERGQLGDLAPGEPVGHAVLPDVIVAGDGAG